MTKRRDEKGLAAGGVVEAQPGGRLVRVGNGDAETIVPEAWDGQRGDSNPDVAPVVLVRFLKRDAPFEQGEERTFPALTAQKFIRQGVAEEVVGG